MNKVREEDSNTEAPSISQSAPPQPQLAIRPGDEYVPIDERIARNPERYTSPPLVARAGETVLQHALLGQDAEGRRTVRGFDSQGSIIELAVFYAALRDNAYGPPEWGKATKTWLDAHGASIDGGLRGLQENDFELGTSWKRRAAFSARLLGIDGSTVSGALTGPNPKAATLNRLIFLLDLPDPIHYIKVHVNADTGIIHYEHEYEKDDPRNVVDRSPIYEKVRPQAKMGALEFRYEEDKSGNLESFFMHEPSPELATELVLSPEGWDKVVEYLDERGAERGMTGKTARRVRSIGDTLRAGGKISKADIEFMRYFHKTRDGALLRWQFLIASHLEPAARAGHWRQPSVIKERICGAKPGTGGLTWRHAELDPHL